MTNLYRVKAWTGPGFVGHYAAKLRASEKSKEEVEAQFQAYEIRELAPAISENTFYMPKITVSYEYL